MALYYVYLLWIYYVYIYIGIQWFYGNFFNDTMLFFTCPVVLLCLLGMYYGITVLFLTVYWSSM